MGSNIQPRRHTRRPHPHPERPSNCTFANDGQTLYVTARMSLYRITLNTEDDG